MKSCRTSIYMAMHKAASKVLLYLLVPVLLMLVACFTNASPKPPCDEKINDPKVYESIILDNSVIQQLNNELRLQQVNVSPCIVDNKVSIGILYELPVSYSDFGIIYSDYLSLAYSKDGTIVVSGGIKPPSTFEKEAILGYFRQRIHEIESNPRIREVIVKTEPDLQNPVTPLFGQAQVSRRGNNRVEYSFYSGLVRGYSLSNDIDWQEFPEIEQAHEVIKKKLLIGALASCLIGRDDEHSYTSSDFHDASTGPWYLTVALNCDDGWKDAFMQINNDGSYERLEIRYEYKSK